jgi:hypothetical protein
MSTLLLLAFEVAPLSKDACDPPVQSHEPYGLSQMGQKRGEVNCSLGFAPLHRHLVYHLKAGMFTTIKSG